MGKTVGGLLQNVALAQLNSQKTAPENDRMNGKQRRFVEEYLIDLNAQQAAERAGYSKKSIRSQGSRLLANAGVRAAVDTAIAERSAGTWLTAQWVLEKLRANYEAAVKDGNHAAANKALELLGKHQGMFRDVTEHTGNLSLLDLVGQASEEPELEEPQIH